MTQESNVTKVKRVLNAVAAGTSNQNGAAVDTQGFQGVRFLVAVGAITATAVTSIKVQEGNAANLSDAADLAGSGIAIAADGSDDNSVFVVDVYKPAKRYLRVVVLRGTANAVIDGAFAELYEGRVYPEARDASVHGQVLLTSPAEGTP
jgi:hypothetical protein